MKPAGWEVTAADGFTSLHKERAAADRWAVQCHGTVDALYRGRDLATATVPNPGRESDPSTQEEPTMGVRAKFTLIEVTQAAGSSARRLRFSAMYDPSIPEDQRFQKATPWGQFDMTVDNPAALEQLQLGQAYYFDVTPADPPAAA